VALTLLRGTVWAVVAERSGTMHWASGCRTPHAYLQGKRGDEEDTLFACVLVWVLQLMLDLPCNGSSVKCCLSRVA
jgi:hypothetical protein